MGVSKKRIILSVFLTVCFIFFTVTFIKTNFFADRNFNDPIINIKNYYEKNTNVVSIDEADTFKVTKNIKSFDDDIIFDVNDEKKEIKDDGSIIFDGLTLTQLTNKLNKSLTNELSGTGYYFASYTKKTGLDPYLAVAIVLHETGCSSKCSSLVINCNNIGGLKTNKLCSGYGKYDTLTEGINDYLDILYNNYYAKGLKTAADIGPKYANNSEWANKVNNFYNKIKE